MGTAGTVNKAQIYRDVEQHFGLVPEWVKRMPDVVLGGFWANMRDFELAETVIPNKYKDLIGLAVAGATRCKYCTLFHTESARLAGATDEEIAEASAMGAMTMMASTFINAQQIDYAEFRKETLEIVKFAKQQQAKRPAGAQAHA